EGVAGAQDNAGGAQRGHPRGKQPPAPVANTSVVMLELECPTRDRYGIGTAGSERESGIQASTGISEEDAAELRRASCIGRAQDTRTSPISHLQGIDQLAGIFSRTHRVKVGRAGLGTHDRYRAAVGRTQKSQRTHHGICKPRASLSKLDERSLVVQ